MGDEVAVCILCDKELLEDKKRTIGERAIASLVKASKERKDKKYLRLQQHKSLDIHPNCHTAYVRERNVTAAAKQASASTSRARRSGSGCRNFDFKSLCFLCGDDASESYIKKRIKCTSSRNYSKVIFVCKSETAANILDNITDRSFQKDEYHKQIRERLINAGNLVELNARYHLNCMTKFYNYRQNKSTGRTPDESILSCLHFVFNYITENSEECQFSLRYILDQYAGEIPSIQYLKVKLAEYLGKEVVIYSVKNDYVICFLDMRDNILTNDWYNNRSKNEEEEKTRIVQAAADIILQDIRSRYYDLKNYPSPNCFLDNSNSDISVYLKSFLDILIKSSKKTKNSDKWDNQIATYAHCITSSVRPRSFISPILLGLSSMMHKKHASKSLIDTLHNVGLCASYEETLLFENENDNSEDSSNNKKRRLQ